MKIQEKKLAVFFFKYFIMQKFVFQNEMKCISHQCFNWMVTIHPYSRRTQVHQLSLCWLWPRHLTSLEQRLAVRARRLIQQQKGNVNWQRETFRKGLNVTSGAQLIAALPLVKPVVSLCSPSSIDAPVLLLNQPIIICILLHSTCTFYTVVCLVVTWQTCQT